MSLIPEEQLREMKATITAECVDDPEEILDWFAGTGPSLIDEVLAYRAEAGAKSEQQPVVSLATLPKLYKNPACYDRDGVVICNVFADRKPGEIVLEIRGDNAEVVARCLIQMQG